MKTYKISKNFCGKTILSALRGEGYFSAPCGGNGRCGKCKLRVLSGEILPSAADKNLLTEKEIEQGVRLACTAVVNGDLEVEILYKENDFKIEESNFKVKDNNFKMKKSSAVYGIVGDIGTTTLVFSLINLSDASVVKTYSTLNSQRKYGADLMTRLSFAETETEKELTRLLRADIAAAVNILCGEEKNIKKIVLTGHTVLFHSILGYPLKPLSVYPFENKMNGLVAVDYKDIFTFGNEREKYCKVFFLPSIAAYAGSDLLAGIGFCGLKNGDILLDMGTNTEMAIKMNDTLICTSAAAGPALEAGNISCGTGSIAGAIDRVSLYAGRFFVKTIEDKTPVGICGTGLIDAVGCLLTGGIMDSTGFIGVKYQSEGLTLYEDEKSRIFINQKDIREFQLAKAAIRAGLECLLQNAGMSWDEVNRLYIAGGFGSHINKSRAIQTGILPNVNEEKIITVGNSSLGGARMAAISDKFINELIDLRQKTCYKNLSSEENFQKLFFAHMNFSVKHK